MLAYRLTRLLAYRLTCGLRLLAQRAAQLVEVGLAVLYGFFQPDRQSVFVVLGVVAGALEIARFELLQDFRPLSRAARIAASDGPIGRSAPRRWANSVSS